MTLGGTAIRIAAGYEDTGTHCGKNHALNETPMNKRRYTKIIHEDKYVALVDVEMIYSEEGWSPYISLDDAYKLDDIRETLKRGDVKTAAKLARIYTLTPVSV